VRIFVEQRMHEHHGEATAPEKEQKSTRAQTPSRSWIWIVLGLLLIATGSCYLTREYWIAWIDPASATEIAEAQESQNVTAASEQVTLTAQAQKNLGLISKPLKADTFWKTITVPGMVIDRPGFSDRGIVAPVTGIVSGIHRVAGDNVKPGTVLFTLKLLSESIHLTQSELFKATQDIKLAQSQRQRLMAAAGAVAEARVIEVDNQITRLEVGAKAYRQELLNRGLPPAQIQGVTEGNFISEINIVVPDRQVQPAPANGSGATDFEIQELKVELGQQVQAGQTMCLLSNHQMLSIEGRAFRDESACLERTVRERWPVDVDFSEENTPDWPIIQQNFKVSYIANNIDPESRTFRFLLPLDNQSRVVAQSEKSQTLWRFRPGQRVRLMVRTDAIHNVFILPTEAVARDGAEAYVFRQNGDVFDRKPVHVVFQDRRNIVIANDGSVPPGIYVAQLGAAQLNRMVKSQDSTMPKGFHIHADGSVHMGNH
jgi:multidrug efflux pump subunit AcrA (membrane-fusion protein)